MSGDLAAWVSDALQAAGLPLAAYLGLRQGDGRVAQIVNDRVERLNLFGVEVRSLVGMTDDEILDRFASTPALVDLFVRIYEELRRSSAEEKRMAFARLMAAVLDDDGAEIDGKRRLERALEGLEVAHMRALKAIAAGPPAFITGTVRGTPTALLAGALPATEGVASALAAWLNSFGLVYDAAIGTWGYDEAHWAVTEFGEDLITYLVDV